MQKIISEIVKEREKQRLSETELAKKLGIGQKTLNNILSGKTQKPDYKTIQELLRVLGISFNPLDDLVRVPIYAAEAVGITNEGEGRINDLPEIASYLSFTRNYARVAFGTAANLVCLKAAGDSMVPFIMPGDMLVIDQSDVDLERDGAAYILQIGKTTVVKRMQRLSHLSIRITSDNPDGWKRDIQLSDLEREGIAIAGRVVAVIKMA
jgi:phage repressor protein C with HTH and peptisase S24 domain